MDHGLRDARREKQTGKLFSCFKCDSRDTEVPALFTVSHHLEQPKSKSFIQSIFLPQMHQIWS